MADPITGLIIMTVVISSSAIANASYESSNICDVDDQITTLQNKYDDMQNQWEAVTTDQESMKAKLEDDYQTLITDVKDTQLTIVSTQSKLRRQKILLSLVSFLIVLIVGLSLLLKLFLKKQNDAKGSKIKFKDLVRIT